MKKRYARILAATLSAAMVFTSAPASVFDTGVIEAEAAATLGSKTTSDVDTVLGNFKFEAQYAGDEVTDEDTYATAAIAAYNNSASNIGTLAIEGTHNTAVTKAKIGQTITMDVKFTLSGDYAATGDGWSGASSNEYVTTITIDIVKKKVQTSEITYPADECDYYYGSGVAAETVLKTKGASAAYNLQGFTVTSLSPLTTAAAGTTTTIELTKAVSDSTLETDDYSAVEGFVASRKAIVKNVTVNVKANTAGLAAIQTALADVAAVTSTKATMTVGDTKAVLTGTNAALFEIVSYKQPIDKYDVENSAGKLGAYTKAVKLASVSEFDKANYAVSTVLSAVPSATYNESTKKFEIYAQLEVSPKELNASNIVWPTKATTDVVAGMNLNNVKLEETATCKYGSFKVSTTGGVVATTAKTKYDIVFTVNSNATVASTTDVYGITVAGGTITKPDGITLNIAKAVLKDDSIIPTLSHANMTDKKEFYYGTTYAALVKEGESDKVSYVLKGVQGTDLLPIGQSNVVYTVNVLDPNKYTFEDGKTTKEISIPVKVVAPKVEFEMALNTNPDLHVVGVDSNDTAPCNLKVTPKITDTLASVTASGMADATLAGKYDYAIEWYAVENGKATKVYGVNGDTLKVDDSKMNTMTYYCVVKPSVKSSVTNANEKAVLTQIIGSGSFTTEQYEVTVSNMTLTPTDLTGASDLEFSKIDEYDVAQISVTPGADYELASASWYYIDIDDEAKTKHPIEGTINKAANIVSVPVPTDLQAGSYKFYCSIKCTSTKYADDIALGCVSVDVDTTALPNGLDPSVVEIAKADRTLTYGAKVKDIKFTPAKDAEKYGKYVWIKPNHVLECTENSATLTFVPSSFAQRNYTECASGIMTITVTGLTVNKADLVVKPADVVVNVGDKLPSVDSIKCDVTGLADGDTLEDLGIFVTCEYAKSVDTSVAGTIAGAVKVSVSVPASLTNYNTDVKTATGAVIVKAAATPSVKPTPAPVKQAVAAKAKAVKSKVTVKVGKKYTLKVKFAAGKKATVKKVKWTSSKKKVATVSSKGKVTAKKAGKAAIYARVYFKDGSMKKIKFTVTVK